MALTAAEIVAEHEAAENAEAMATTAQVSQVKFYFKRVVVMPGRRGSEEAAKIGTPHPSPGN